LNGKAFVIHLRRATTRRHHVEELQRACPFPTEIVDAVDGKFLSSDEIAAVYDRNRHLPAYPFVLRRAEIGCFLSHRLCWQKIVDEDLPYAAVFEDDAALDGKTIAKALMLVEKHIQSCGYIQLPVRPIAGNSTVVAEDQNVQMLKPAVTQLRLSGQFISQTAARELLRLTALFDRPVDTFLQMHWLTGIRALAVTPSGLSDCTRQAGGSTISQNKTMGVRVGREVKRFFYRRKIDKLSMAAADGI
jgi:GR25 family glycosyltransferase involved in LPS biosynthesis